MNYRFLSTPSLGRSGCEFDCGAGLHVGRSLDLFKDGGRRRFASCLGILILIPHDGSLIVELGNGTSVAMAASRCATWVINLKYGASIVRTSDVKYSSIQVALSALECLDPGSGVQSAVFPMVGEYPADTVLGNSIDALCQHVLALPAGICANADFCHAIGTAIKYHVLRTYTGQTIVGSDATGMLTPWQLHTVKAAMLTRLEAGVDAGELAKLCGISTSQLRRAFFASTGKSLHRWLVHQRVDQACDDLLGTSLPVAEIALRRGFSDQSHLTRTFAAILGITPAKWRNAHLVMA